MASLVVSYSRLGVLAHMHTAQERRSCCCRQKVVVDVDGLLRSADDSETTRGPRLGAGLQSDKGNERSRDRLREILVNLITSV